jgi:hypothetical protein
MRHLYYDLVLSLSKDENPQLRTGNTRCEKHPRYLCASVVKSS